MNRHQFQNAARQFRAGKLRLDDFTDQVFPASKQRDVAGAWNAKEADSLFEQIRTRRADSHKGDYGRVLLIAGSPGMAGAAALAGMSSLRCGSGTVTVASLGAQRQVAGFHPAMMTIELGDFVTTYLELCEHFADPATLPFDALAIGPGLEVTRSAKSLVNSIVAQCPIPVVVDAGAISCLSDSFDWSSVKGPRVLTPHPGETKRLMAEPSIDRKVQLSFAQEIVKQQPNVTFALKGHRTQVVDTSSTTINETGNPGMATAGSGDVLTGIIVSLIGQGLNCGQATRLGCYLHGKAGDVAAKIYSQPAMIATDIIDCLPKVFAKKTT